MAPVDIPDGGDELSIGDLAALTGVTVRTLHHYDEIGLLPPHSRTASGHRRYDPTDVVRLQRIVGLRSLGLSLNDIAEAIDGDEGSTSAVARRQLDQVVTRIAELTDLEVALTRLLGQDEHPATTALEITAMTIRLDRITTRTGDRGTTALASGQRVAKTDARIEAIGNVDELNAVIGIAIDAAKATGDSAGLVDTLLEVQQQLFDAGADLSTPSEPDKGRLITTASIEHLDTLVVATTDNLEPLRSFVLPNGPAGASQLHLARTVCRRAERSAWAVDDDTGHVAPYLNRLADLLFVLARNAAGPDAPTWRTPDQEGA